MTTRKHTCRYCQLDKSVSEGEWHWIDNFQRWICHLCLTANNWAYGPNGLAGGQDR